MKAQKNLFRLEPLTFWKASVSSSVQLSNWASDNGIVEIINPTLGTESLDLHGKCTPKQKNLLLHAPFSRLFLNMCFV